MSEISKLNFEIDSIQEKIIKKNKSPVLRGFIDYLQENNLGNKKKILIKKVKN